MKRISLFLVLVVVAGSLFATAPVQTLSNGMRVSPKKGAAKTIEISVVNSRIIRVQAVPTGEIPSKASLCVIPQTNSVTGFKVSKEGKFASLTTDELIVKVSLVTEEVSFFDKSGKVLLEEMPNGKDFKPFTAQNDNGYTMQQIFKGTQGEAIYGLGQHQSDDFNYKNKSEDLFQYNTKVSVPFIVSTANYGILWDNYSQSKYGDPRDYKDLDQFTLFDKDGKEGTLTATYNQKSNPAIVRQEKAIDYENLKTVKNSLRILISMMGQLFGRALLYRLLPTLTNLVFTTPVIPKFGSTIRWLCLSVGELPGIQTLSGLVVTWRKANATKLNWSGNPMVVFRTLD